MKGPTMWDLFSRFLQRGDCLLFKDPNRCRSYGLLSNWCLPKQCKKDIKNIPPTLPSPLRGGGLGWGAKGHQG
jgi:hypothetical protein